MLRSGQLVRELREAAGLTPKRLCSEIGMNPSQLSDIERGIQTISLRRAYQISEVLRVSFDDVIAAILEEKLADAGFRNTSVNVSTAALVNGTHVDEGDTLELPPPSPTMKS